MIERKLEEKEKELSRLVVKGVLSSEERDKLLKQYKRILAAELKMTYAKHEQRQLEYEARMRRHGLHSFECECGRRFDARRKSKCPRCGNEVYKSVATVGDSDSSWFEENRDERVVDSIPGSTSDSCVETPQPPGA